MSGAILVVGGAGYIGSRMAKMLVQSGHEVIILDNLSTGFRDAARYGRLIEGDLADQALLDRIFNAGGLRQRLRAALRESALLQRRRGRPGRGSGRTPRPGKPPDSSRSAGRQWAPQSHRHLQFWNQDGDTPCASVPGKSPLSARPPASGPSARWFMRGAPDSRTARDALLSPQHPGSGM